MSGAVFAEEGKSPGASVQGKEVHVTRAAPSTVRLLNKPE